MKKGRLSQGKQKSREKRLIILCRKRWKNDWETEQNILKLIGFPFNYRFMKVIED